MTLSTGVPSTRVPFTCIVVPFIVIWVVPLN